MSAPHPTTRNTYVRYFYLPASTDRYAEVIEVLNSRSEVIEVPMREEDVELHAFFARPLTGRELESYRRNEVWKVFSTWEEVKHDHFAFDLPDDLVEQLLRFRYIFGLHEEMAA